MSLGGYNAASYMVGGYTVAGYNMGSYGMCHQHWAMFIKELA
jgi:hypothetical protein